MKRLLNYYWRLFGTGFSFAMFGIGGVLMSITLFPLIHLLSRSREAAHRRCQYFVHKSFRLFIWQMHFLGVMTYEIHGAEKLAAREGALIVANHPSLIDVVFIIAFTPHALCVVKKAAWFNPFMAGVMWATGYIPNDDPQQLIDDCVACLARGNTLVLFPEGTRTVPGQPMKLKRGAASIIAKSRKFFTPVSITSRPTTLTKAEKWYEIPETRVHFKLFVGDPVDPRPEIVEGEYLGQTTRRYNRVLRDVLLGSIERHGNIG